MIAEKGLVMLLGLRKSERPQLLEEINQVVPSPVLVRCRALYNIDSGCIRSADLAEAICEVKVVGQLNRVILSRLP